LKESLERNNENVDVILEAWEHLAAGKLAEALEVLGVDYVLELEL